MPDSDQRTRAGRILPGRTHVVNKQAYSPLIGGLDSRARPQGCRPTNVDQVFARQQLGPQCLQQ